jgi:hypothetical protein
MFEMTVKQHGNTVLTYKNYGTPEEHLRELKGIKSHREGRRQDHIFMFAEDPNVENGDILKLKLASELWKAVRKTETIANDIVIKHVVDVVSLNSSTTSPRSGQNVTINSHGPIHGGILVNSPMASQYNIVQAGIHGLQRSHGHFVTLLARKVNRWKS